MRTEISRFIQSDIEAIANYIAEDNPARAVSCIREIRDAIRLIGQNPLLYQLRPEVGEGARLAVVSQSVCHLVSDRRGDRPDRTRGLRRTRSARSVSVAARSGTRTFPVLL